MTGPEAGVSGASHHAPDYYQAIQEHNHRWDEYLIPGTNTLRNKLESVFAGPFGISHPESLQHAELQITMLKTLELTRRPLPGKFDLAHMQRIHSHLFDEVYEWAGQLRTVNMTKQDVSYLPHAQIQNLWDNTYEALAENDFLRDITNKEEFVGELAFYWGMLNHAHSFREGNTRTQMIYFHDLARQAGWELDLTRFAPHAEHSVRDEFVDARFHFQHAGLDSAPLAAVLSQVISPLPTPQRTAGFTRPGLSLPQVAQQLPDAIVEHKLSITLDNLHPPSSNYSDEPDYP